MNHSIDPSQWLARMRKRNGQVRRRRRALVIAMQRFAKLHPEWYESLFDEVFVARLPADAIAEMASTELAREWTRQFTYCDQRRRERDVRQLTPVAESFLRLLLMAEDELAARRSAAPTDAILGGRDQLI
jgi:hypothetical protein